MDLSHLTHLTNCHGEWTALLAGLPILGFILAKWHALKAKVKHRFGWHTKCCEPHEHK